jgi:hypothetical protein
MKIRVSDPSLVDDLLWFLEAKQCAVERLERRVAMRLASSLACRQAARVRY